jgi:hypothetical protein
MTITYNLKLLLERYPDYATDMILKGVSNVQTWTYVTRIEEWSDLRREYPESWRGVLMCTDAYEELQRREQLPRCNLYTGCARSLHGSHYMNHAHHPKHASNIELEKLAYNQAIELLECKHLPACIDLYELWHF